MTSLWRDWAREQIFENFKYESIHLLRHIVGKKDLNLFLKGIFIIIESPVILIYLCFGGRPYSVARLDQTSYEYQHRDKLHV